MYLVTSHHCWKPPHLLTHWRHGYIMLFHSYLCSGCRSLSTVKEQGGKWGSCFGVITVNVWHINSPPQIMCHLCCEARSLSSADIRQEEYISAVKGCWRRSRLTLQLLLRFMTFSAHFPSDANIRLHISCQWSSHRGGFDFLPSSCLLYTGRELAQCTPSGRPSWTEKSLTAAGEEVDERMDRWEKWCQWQARSAVTVIGYYQYVSRTEQNMPEYQNCKRLQVGTKFWS